MLVCYDFTFPSVLLFYFNFHLVLLDIICFHPSRSPNSVETFDHFTSSHSQIAADFRYHLSATYIELTNGNRACPITIP